MELKRSVVRGMVWSTVEKAGTILFQMCVSLIVARLLTPEDYGLIGILVVFTSVCSVFVDSGFSSALIRKREVSGEEYSAVFVFNISVAVLLYFILLAITPMIARYYEIPLLQRVAPVLFLLVPVNSLCNIQSTILTRKLDFKSITKYTLWANFIASGVAIAFAISGFGVWTLVAQRLTTPAVRSLLLWIKSDWKPSRKISLKPLKSMLGYGSKLLLSDLANSIYANVSQLFIGKMYSPSQLGFYEQGRKLKDMPVTSVISSIQGVTFPALSQLQDNHDKMSDSAHKITTVMNYVMFPVMIGLIAIAGDMFRVLLPERWLPTVPYFQIMCISGFFAPLSVVSYNLLKIKSDGRMIFRLEIIKKIIATLILAATIPVSVKAIVWGQTIIFLSDAILNTLGANRYVKWRLWDRVKCLSPYLVMSLIVWGVVYGVGEALGGVIALHWILIIKILVGILAYLIQSIVFRPAAWREIVEIFHQATGSRIKL